MAKKKTRPAWDGQALVAHVLDGCGPDAFRGVHVALRLAEAEAIIDDGAEVSRERCELAYGSEPPSPIETVSVERGLAVGGIGVTERVTVNEVRRPSRPYLSAEWIYRLASAGDEGGMKAVAKALKLELAGRLKKGSSKSDFRFERDGRRNVVFVGQGPGFVRVVLTDAEF